MAVMDPREIAKAILDRPFGEVMAQAQLADVSQAIAGYEAGRVSLLQTIVDWENDPVIERLGNALKPLGAKLAPTLSAAQTSAWRSAVVLSIAKWPEKVAMSAIRRAVSEPIPFGLNGADEVLHRLAAEIDERHQLALNRLRTMQRALARAADTSHQLPAPPTDDSPMPQDEVNSLAPHFLRMGLDAGFITQEQHDAAVLHHQNNQVDRVQDDGQIDAAVGKPQEE